MLSKIRFWAYGIIAGLLAFAGVWSYRKGASSAKQNMMEDDYEHAEDIRRRVNDNRDDRVRKLDDTGWRD